MQLKKILFIVLVIIPRFSFSQKIKLEWIYVATSTSGDTFWINTKAVNNNYPYVKIWTMSNRQKLKWNGKIYYKAKCKKLEEFDCSTRSSRFFTAAYYDSHDRLIDYNSTQVMGLDPEWDDIIPDSVGEKMLDEICNTYRTEKLNN